MGPDYEYIHLGRVSIYPCFILCLASKRDEITYVHLSELSEKNEKKTNPFNGHFSGTTQVSRYQKGKTNLDSTEARDSEWQWHQLGHMQVCTLLQTDNHASNPPLSFLEAGFPSCRQPSASKH